MCLMYTEDSAERIYKYMCQVKHLENNGKNPIGIPGGSRKELGSEDFTYPNELIKILFSSACTHDSHHLERILVENSKTRHHFMRLVKSIEINIVKEQNLTTRMAHVRLNKIHTFYKKQLDAKNASPAGSNGNRIVM